MPLPPALGRGSASAINRANRRSLSLSEPASHPSLQPSSLTTTSSTITASCKVGRSKPLAPSEDMPRLHWGCNDRLTRLGWQREREVPGWARLLPQASTSRAAPRGTSLLPSIPYHFTQQPGDQLAQHSHSEDGRLGSQAEGGGERREGGHPVPRRLSGRGKEKRVPKSRSVSWPPEAGSCPICGTPAPPREHKVGRGM